MPGEDVQQAKEAFGDRLRELRNEASLTGRALARLTGLHYTKISRAENGRQSVTDAEIRAWCGLGGEFHPDYGVVLRAALFAVDRHRSRQVTAVTTEPAEASR